MIAIRVGPQSLEFFSVIFTFSGMVAVQTVKTTANSKLWCFHSLCPGQEVRFWNGKRKILPYFCHFPRYFRFFAQFREFQQKRSNSVNAAAFPRSQKVPMSGMHAVSYLCNGMKYLDRLTNINS